MWSARVTWLAVQLHEPVHEFVDELRRGVRLAVPPLVGVGRQAEVGPEIDDVRAATEQIRDDQLRRTVREADEHDVGAVHVGRRRTLRSTRSP